MAIMTSSADVIRIVDGDGNNIVAEHAGVANPENIAVTAPEGAQLICTNGGDEPYLEDPIDIPAGWKVVIIHTGTGAGSTPRLTYSIRSK